MHKGIISGWLVGIVLSMNACDPRAQETPAAAFVVAPAVAASAIHRIGDFTANGRKKWEWEAGYGYIDRRGEFVIAPRDGRSRSFAANGLAAARSPGNKLWGYIDAHGHFVILSGRDSRKRRISRPMAWRWLRNRGKNMAILMKKARSPFVDWRDTCPTFASYLSQKIT
jgi:hypothetical protein